MYSGWHGVQPKRSFFLFLFFVLFLHFRVGVQDVHIWIDTGQPKAVLGPTQPCCTGSGGWPLVPDGGDRRLLREQVDRLRRLCLGRVPTYILKKCIHSFL